MAKKVYAGTVNKWAVAGGLSGSAGAILLVWYLVSIGAIVVTGYSQDVVCAGTDFDPCYAYINFTAKDNIYVYPGDYGNTGPEPFMLGAGVKSWMLEQKLKNGSWKAINLSKPASTSVKYSVKWANNTKYEIRVIALKERFWDDVKWGFASVDPLWLGYQPESFFTFDRSDVSLTHSCSYYTVKNPTSFPANIKEDQMLSVLPYDEFYGRITAANWELAYNNSYAELVWNDLPDKCSQVDHNGTISTECVKDGFYENVTKYRLEYGTVANISLQPYEEKSVRFCGTHTFARNTDRGAGTVEIDHKPIFMGYNYTQYALWNTTWKVYYPLCGNNTDELAHIDEVSKVLLNSTQCASLPNTTRIIYQNTTETLFEYYSSLKREALFVNNQSIVASTNNWCYFAVYCNATGVSEANGTIFLTRDDAEDGDTAGWTADASMTLNTGGGAAFAGNHYFNITMGATGSDDVYWDIPTVSANTYALLATKTTTAITGCMNWGFDSAAATYVNSFQLESCQPANGTKTYGYYDGTNEPRNGLYFQNIWEVHKIFLKPGSSLMDFWINTTKYYKTGAADRGTANPVEYFVAGSGTSSWQIGFDELYFSTQNISIYSNPTTWFLGAEASTAPGDQAPSVASTTITPASPREDDRLNCSAVPTDDLAATLTLNFTWWKNGALNTNWEGSVSCANGSTCYTNTLVPSPAMSGSDIFICSARAADNASQLSSWVNSSSVNITSCDSSFTVDYSQGTAAFLLNPTTGNSTNVEPDNQTGSKGVFNFTRASPSACTNLNITALLNQTMSNMTFCGGWTNASNSCALFHSTTNATIAFNMTNSSSAFGWVFVNYSFPTSGQAFSFSFESVKT